MLNDFLVGIINVVKASSFHDLLWCVFSVTNITLK